MFNVPGVSNKEILGFDNQYESPYYRKVGGDFKSLIVGGINTNYWKYMLNQIEEMNRGVQ